MTASSTYNIVKPKARLEHGTGGAEKPWLRLGSLRKGDSGQAPGANELRYLRRELILGCADSVMGKCNHPTCRHLDDTSSRSRHVEKDSRCPKLGVESAFGRLFVVERVQLHVARPFFRQGTGVPVRFDGMCLRDSFCEGEQDLDGGGHPPSRAGNRTFTPRNSRGI